MWDVADGDLAVLTEGESHTVRYSLHHEVVEDTDGLGVHMGGSYLRDGEFYIKGFGLIALNCAD